MFLLISLGLGGAIIFGFLLTVFYNIASAKMTLKNKNHVFVFFIIYFYGIFALFLLLGNYCAASILKTNSHDVESNLLLFWAIGIFLSSIRGGLMFSKKNKELKNMEHK
jgi:hypothetical protein